MGRPMAGPFIMKPQLEAATVLPVYQVVVFSYTLLYMYTTTMPFLPITMNHD